MLQMVLAGHAGSDVPQGIRRPWLCMCGCLDQRAGSKGGNVESLSCRNDGSSSSCCLIKDAAADPEGSIISGSGSKLS